MQWGKGAPNSPQPPRPTTSRQTPRIASSTFSTSRLGEEPGTTDTLVFAASTRARCFKPISSVAYGLGPSNFTSASSNLRAYSAFWERNPYRGWTNAPSLVRRTCKKSSMSVRKPFTLAAGLERFERKGTGPSARTTTV